MSKKIIWTVVIIVVAIAAWMWYSGSSSSQPVSNAAPIAQPTANPVPTGPSAPAPTPAPEATVDNSNAGLQNDLNAIDAQTTNLNSDAAAADQSIASSSSTQ